MGKKATKQTLGLGTYIVDKGFMVAIIVLIFALTLDTAINQVSDFLGSSLYSTSGIMLFIGLAAVFGICGILMFKVLIGLNRYSTSHSKVQKLTFFVVCGIQLFLLLNIAIIIFEISINSAYHSSLLLVSSLISYLLNVAILGFLTFKLAGWFFIDKRSISILLYCISFLVIIVASVTAIIIDSTVLLSKQETIYQGMEVVFPTFENDSALAVPSDIYHYSSDISFALMWLATVLLIYNYRNRVGIIKFWIITSMPLVYYIGTSIDTLGIYIPPTDEQSYYFYLYTSLNSTAGGILFGCVFWIIARKVVIREAKSYLIITGLGFALFFISSQVTLTPSPYPPFGVVTLSFYGFSVYLIFFGLHSTALHMSRDVNLRLAFRKILGEQSTLFNSMGFAEMDIETRKKIVASLRNVGDMKEFYKAGNVEPSDYEIKMYIEDVLKEIHLNKSTNPH